MKIPKFIKAPIKRLGDYQNRSVLEHQMQILKNQENINNRLNFIENLIKNTLSEITAKEDLTLFSLYKKDNEKIIDARKRFFKKLKQEDPILAIKQDALYILLKKFVSICEKNRIIYWVTYGTLLGAVRHQNFVPWDDDIDIAMPEKEIDRFVKIFKKNDKHFAINYYYTPDLGIRMPRLMFKKYPDIGYIDIYPQTEIFCNSQKAIEIYKKAKANLVKDIMQTDWFPTNYLPFYHNQVDEKLPKSVDLIITSHNKEFLNQLNTNKEFNGYISSIYNIPPTNENTIIYMSVKDVFPFKKLKFRDLKVNSINNYNKFLHNWYGNYYKLPNDITTHCHIKLFLSDEEINFIKSFKI